MFRSAIFLALGAAMATYSYAQTLQQTRTSGFEYDPVSNLLIREVIEPNDSALCLVTTYQYDAYGNKTGATTRNCNGTSSGGLTETTAPTCSAPGPTCDAVFTSRTSSTSFAANSINIVAGQFPTSSTNAANQTESRTFDPRFGSIKTLTGPNLLTTTWSYDPFGRKTSETRADGTSTTWTYRQCVTSFQKNFFGDIVGLTSNCNPGGSPDWANAYSVTVTSSGAPTSTTYYDTLNRAVYVETEGFDGTLVVKATQYDALGRVFKVSQPYVAGMTPVWTTYGYDILGRVKQVDEPATASGQARTATTYQGLVTTVTVSNAGAGTGMPGGAMQVRTTTKNSQGQVTQVTQQ